MSKQSSVEHYILKLIDILGDEIINKISAEQNERIARLEKQAKAMHKEETTQFAVDWFQNCPIGGDVNSIEDATEYYKDTFA